MNRLVLLFFALCLFVGTSYANDIAVVVDVSGSMRTYGAWQRDALAAIGAVMRGNDVEPQWELTGSSASLKDFVLGAGNHVYLVPFGSASPEAKFPYFDHVSGPLNLDDWQQRFPLTDSVYIQAKTNKPLAQAVAVQTVGASGQSAIIIMVSDFLVDASVSESQQDFVNKMETSYSVYTPVTLSWRVNKHVQIKLMRYDSKNPIIHPPPENNGEPPIIGILSLLPPKYTDKPRKLSFAWKFQGSSVPKEYSVSVREARTGKGVFSKSNLAVTNVTYPDPAVGSLKWSVTAELQDGSTVRQMGEVIVPQNPPPLIPIILFLVFVAAILGCVWWWMNKTGSLPKWLQFGKKSEVNDF